ncbi:replication restart DNA helicase PriA [Thermoanaerobacter uzonensis DSM 18761]|uniref:Replication restart protein PriA n=1 Tax=Thermoanaerobacter uzonensis DSM 18761 TaxID=1123369 RepID=A0A1M4UJS7_9THEO|nr:primosomal protein N' [Thermoanaerobacter uzonensis]SHE56996.1 replication restart DNA helicase PriA [Thermoanaerobacter uzonensis DSM 18761]
MFAEVIVDIKSSNTDRVYTYRIPEGMDIKVGMRVSVPFNNRFIDGYVISITDKASYSVNKIKDIHRILDSYSIFDEKMIELAKWIKEYYKCYFSEALQTIMPVGIKQGEKKVKVVKTNIDEIPFQLSKRAPKQYEILQYLKNRSPIRLSELVKVLNIDYGVIRSLQNKGYIEIYEEEVLRFSVKDIERTKPLLLTEEQQRAVEEVKSSILTGTFDKYLLFGVTGSGKTEVYLQLIDEAIKIGKSAIVLVPEISLTPQTIERFVSRFGNRVAVIHSGLSPGERFDEWRKVKNGLVDVVVGVRNAVFAPFNNLGLIIIDEEHETTYKQSDLRPKYNAKEVAEKRCEIEKAVLVMASATPSLETYYKANKGEYKLIRLTKRINVSMPQIEVVNMSEELASGNTSIFSRKLFSYIKENLKRKEQTILFLNRRGYSSFVSCRDCGYVPKCPNCDISLTYHFEDKKLVCHYCGYEETMKDTCPKCGSKRIRYLGIGTERVENDIKKFFPNARVLRMDVDTTRKKGSHEKIFYDFRNGKADILIGTQMISKGFDIPNVTLVGVILADITLNLPDFRSSERTFQLLTQVAGRAGRGEKPGRVVIQTYEDDHYSIVTAKQQNYVKFYNEEIKYREIFIYPPFSHLMNIVISGEEEEEVKNTAANTYLTCQKLINKLQNKSYNKILGPAPAPISKINNRYRWQVILKSEDRNILTEIAEEIQKMKYPKDIRIAVDIDPLNIM